jgi:uncharacterized membrane protein
LITAQNNIMKTRFVIYGLVGWCSEILWTGLGSFVKGDWTLIGFSSIWMFPIYGMLVLIEPIHERIRYMPVIIRGGVYTLLIYAGEFLSGFLLLAILGKCPWNYGVDKYSILGIITLKYIPVWFVYGLLFEKFHDFLKKQRIGVKRIF